VPRGAFVTRVLVVEDDPDIRDVLVQALLDDDYEVEWAEDGLAGQAITRSSRPALVIIDMMLPGLNGRDFIRECRADPECAATKFILVSAFHGDRLSDVEADAVIQKPFNLGSLMDTVAQLIQSAALERQ
jgi:two-component system sensor histidine kinase/response regulator